MFCFLIGTFCFFVTFYISVIVFPTSTISFDSSLCSLFFDDIFYFFIKTFSYFFSCLSQWLSGILIWCLLSNPCQIILTSVSYCCWHLLVVLVDIMSEIWTIWVLLYENISSVQSLSRVRLFATPWTAEHQASLSITNSWSLLKLMPIELVIPSNHLILCHPLLLLPSIFPSIRIFSNESALRIRWPKYWSFRFSISLSNEYSGLIFYRIDWFDLAVQGTLKSLLQHHSSKISILWM